MFSRVSGHMRQHVVAYLALFFALSGTAVAASLITGERIEDDSLTGADVLESSLGTVPNADRLDGKDSTAFLSGYERISSRVTGTGSASVELEHSARCPSGKNAIGGGFTALRTSEQTSRGIPVKVVLARPETASFFAKVRFDTQAPAGYQHELVSTVICVNAG
jgi:hypothetical protein